MGLLNGMYQMLKADNYDLITENIYKCPKKVGEPLVRAILSYDYIPNKVTIEALLKCFEIYKAYYGETEETKLQEAVTKATELCNSFEQVEVKAYATRVLAAFLDELEGNL